MPFDVQGARAAGYSDDEIAAYLGEQSGFDVAGARKAGYQTAEILDFLSTRKAIPNSGTSEPVSGTDPMGTGASEIMAVAKPDDGRPSPLRAEAENLRDSFFTGVDNTRAALKTVGVAAQANQLQQVQGKLADLEAKGQGESPEAHGLRLTIEHYNRRLPTMISGMTEAQADAQRGAQMTTRPAVAALNQAKTFGEAWDIFKANPYDVIAGVGATSLPTMLPALVTGAVMGPAAGAAVMGGSSAATEAGSSLADFARDSGVDVTDAKAVQAFFSDHKNLADALSYAGKRAGIIGALDTVSGGVAGKTMAPAFKNQFARQAVNIPAQMTVQAGLGAGGEAGGQLATQGAITQPGQVLAEAAGELAGAPMEVMAFSKEARDALRKPQEQQPVTKPLEIISQAKTTDEAIAAAQQALATTPVPTAEQSVQAVQNIERILGETNVSTPTAVPGVDTGATGGGMDLAAAGVGSGVGTDGTQGPAVEQRGSAAELPAADVSRPAGPDLDALRTENAALRSQAIQALQPEQGSTPQVEQVPIARSDVPAEPGLPAAGPAQVEAGRVSVTPKPNGTVLLQGDIQAIVRALEARGITGVPGKSGVTVGKSQAEQAAQLFQPAQVAAAPVATAEPAQQQTAVPAQQPQPMPAESGPSPEQQRAMEAPLESTAAAKQAQSHASKLTARQAAIISERARIEANRAERHAARSQASKVPEGLSIGTTPSTAEPVTVRGNVVYVGKYAAQNFDTGAEVTVPAGATQQQIVSALKNAGALGQKARVFGLQSQEAGVTAPSNTTDHSIGEDRRHEARGTDRRTALDLRKRVADMNESELRQALLTDHLTGLKNRRAYDESAKLPVQVSIDADSLKWVNDNLGHDSGDQLLKAIGQALGDETQEAYHMSGDEFVVQAHSEAEARAIMERARVRMSGAKIEAVDSNGREITLTGVGVSYGIAGDLHEAERFLGKDKSERESQGLRAARGEIPPNAVVSSRGEKDQARGAAAEEVAAPAAPETQSQPAAEKPVSQMSAADHLRAAAEKMDGNESKPAQETAKTVTTSEPEDKTGTEPAFSAVESKAKPSFTAEEFSREIGLLRIRDRHGISVVSVWTAQELPDAVKQAAATAGVSLDKLRGVIMGKPAVIYVVGGNHSTLQEVQETVFHELYGHYGIRNLFGKEMYAKLSDLYARIGPQRFLELAQKYGLNLQNYGNTARRQAAANPHRTERAGGTMEMRQGILMEELLAHIAQSETGTLRQKAREIIGMLRQWLRDHGFAKLAAYGETDLAYLLKQGRNSIVQETTGGPAFMLSNNAKSGRAEETERQLIEETRQPKPRNLLVWKDAAGRPVFAPGQALYDMIGKAADPLLVKLRLKMASPKLRRQLREMNLQIQKAQDTALEVAQESNRLTEGERLMVSDIIEKEMKAGTVPPEHAVRLAAVMNEAMHRQSDELVRLGMLTKEAAAEWDGRYLPRFYESKLRKQIGDAWADAAKSLGLRPKSLKGIKGQHLKGRGIYETIPEDQLANYEELGWKVRDPDYQPGLPSVDGTVQVWRDFSREERDAMGEIRDAGFRFVMGYMQTQKDIALGRMFEAMANDPESSSRLPKQGWIRVPDTTIEGTGAKRYGKLAGRYVPMETLSHLTQIEESQNAAWKMYRKAMSYWKEGKTVLNPVSHMNNVLSNLTMAHFAGIGYHRWDKYAGALRDFVKGAPMMKEARDAGLFLGTMSDAELMNTLPPELKELALKADSKVKQGAEAVYNAMSFWLRKPMGAAYQAEDTFFRYLIYRDARQRGVDPQDAVDYAQKYIFTYDDLPKGARMIRDFGIPFFAYTYKAVPALLNAALTRPDRFLAPAAVLWAANAAAYAIAAGGDDDDWFEKLQKYLTDADFRAKVDEAEKLEREHLPPWMKGKTSLMTPKAVRLGTDELTKLPLFLDTSRIIPGGDIFDVSPNAGGLPIPQPITPSHPLFTIATAMLANKDLYFGKELVDANDTRAEATAKRADWIWKQLSPAIAVNNYHWERGMNALAQATGGELKWVPDALGGAATGIGRDGNPVQAKYAAMQTFGIKVRPIDLETAEMIEENQRQKLIRDIDAEMRNLKRLNINGAVADRVYDAELEKAQQKKDRLREGLTVDGDERK